MALLESNPTLATAYTVRRQALGLSLFNLPVCPKRINSGQYVRLRRTPRFARPAFLPVRGLGQRPKVF